MSPRRLYGIAHSRASRCEWTLRELGLDYEVIPVNDRTGETRRPEFLAINPNGKVPCLVDGDVKLVESLAINLYLARRYDGGLWPSTPAGEGLALQWSFWAQNEIEAPIMRVLYARAAREHDAMLAGLEALDAAVRILESELAGRDYLIESRFTIADLNTAAVCAAGAFFGHDYGAHAEVRAWLRRCYARPAARVRGSTLERFIVLLGP